MLYALELFYTLLLPLLPTTTTCWYYHSQVGEAELSCARGSGRMIQGSCFLITAGEKYVCVLVYVRLDCIIQPIAYAVSDPNQVHLLAGQRLFSSTLVMAAVFIPTFDW